MQDWYTEALSPMIRNWGNAGWVQSYADYTGHFVDDFGDMVRVYAPDENGICHIM